MGKLRTDLHGITTLIAAFGAASLTLFGLTSEARACSPAEPGWQPYPFAIEGTTSGGIASGLSCYSDCDATSIEVNVTDAQGETVEGAVVESEFGKRSGWMLWKPTDSLLEGATYDVSIAAGNADAEPWKYTYTISGYAPSVASIAAPTFEVASVVELPEGVPCCEVSAGAGSECEAPRCYPDPSDARAAVSMAVSWRRDEKLDGYVLVTGEFFTADERVALDPTFQVYASAHLPVADADDAYCYAITTRVLLTGEEKTFEGCKPAAEVASLDVEDEVETANREGLRGCEVPRPEYEQDWCEAFSEEVAANECEGWASWACQNALGQCTQSAPEEKSATPSAATRGDCSVAHAPTSVSPWALSVLACALGAFGVRGRRRRAQTEA